MIETQVLTYPGVVERLGRWLADRIVWVWVVVAIVYAAGFTGQWLPGPDTATHVLLAEAIATGGSLDHPENALRKIEPGLAVMINTMRGVAGWAGVQAGMIVMALATLAMWYATVRLAAGREIAAGTLVLVALCECVYRYAFQALTDMPFAMGVAATMLGYAIVGRVFAPPKREATNARPTGVVLTATTIACVLLLLGGIGWAGQFRSVWLVVLAALLTAAFIDWARRRAWWITGSSAVAAIVAGLVVTLFLLPSSWLGHDESMMWSRVTSELPATLWQALIVNLPALFGEAISEAMIALDAGWWVALPVTVIGFAGAVTLAWRTRQALWLTLLGWFVVQWLLFMVVDRYALPVMAILAAGWWWAALWTERWLTRLRDRPLGATVAVFLLAVWVVPNVLAMGNVLMQFRDDPYRLDTRYDAGRYAGMRPAADWLADQTAGDAAILNRTRAASDVWAVHTGLTTYDGGRQKPWAEHARRWVVAPIDEGPGDLRRGTIVERIETVEGPIGVWEVEIDNGP